MEEYICNLEIAMHGVDFVKSFEAIDDLFQEGGGFVFSESFLAIEIYFEISSVAVFHCDELCFFVAEGVNISDNIFIVTFFEDVDFCLDQFLKFGSLFHEYPGYGLDCDCGVGAFVIALVDDSPGSSSKLFDEVEAFHPLANHVLMHHPVTHVKCTYKKQISNIAYHLYSKPNINKIMIYQESFFRSFLVILFDICYHLFLVGEIVCQRTRKIRIFHCLEVVILSVFQIIGIE